MCIVPFAGVDVKDTQNKVSGAHDEKRAHAKSCKKRCSWHTSQDSKPKIGLTNGISPIFHPCAPVCCTSCWKSLVEQTFICAPPHRERSSQSSSAMKRSTRHFGGNIQAKTIWPDALHSLLITHCVPHSVQAPFL